MIGRRPRFAAVVSRQLDVFAEDEAHGLLADVRDMKSRYDAAGRDEAEEAYGDYADAVDGVKDALAEMRDRYARTLDAGVVDEYAAVFEQAAMKRWRWLA